MIQYVPIEQSVAEGNDLYFINCIWVHGYKEGRGSFRKQGMGKSLLQAAETDVEARGAKGLVAWGLVLPFWMKASWFKQHGYTKVDRGYRFSSGSLSPIKQLLPGGLGSRKNRKQHPAR